MDFPDLRQLADRKSQVHFAQSLNKSDPFLWVASNRKLRVAFDDVLFQLRRFPFFPQRRPLFDAINQRTAVCRIVAFDGSLDADEFGVERIRACAHDSVAVPVHVDEVQMRGIVRIQQNPCQSSLFLSSNRSNIDKVDFDLGFR